MQPRNTIVVIIDKTRFILEKNTLNLEKTNL